MKLITVSVSRCSPLNHNPLETEVQRDSHPLDTSDWIRESLVNLYLRVFQVEINLSQPQHSHLDVGWM